MRVGPEDRTGRWQCQYKYGELVRVGRNKVLEGDDQVDGLELRDVVVFLDDRAWVPDHKEVWASVPCPRYGAHSY